MIKFLFTSLFVFAFNCCFTQYFVVNDKDSFVNVRLKPDVNSKIIYQLPNETIVWASFTDDVDENRNWIHADFYLKNKLEKKQLGEYTPAVMNGFTLCSGFIYKSKLTAIEKLRQLKYKQSKNGYTCFNDSVKIKVLISPFVLSNHKITYQTNDGISLFEKVDNLAMIGTDGSKPNEEIKELSFSLHNKLINIPAISYKNLFNPSFQNKAYCDNKGTIYLVMYNSDAAGAYSCIFIFKDGKFINRLVFIGEC